jgi:hypothetical protein
VNIEHPTSNTEPRTADSAEVVTICPHCGCREFFVRKDFPQKLGLSLVIAAAILFLILAARPSTFYIGVCVLLAVTLIDAVLYFFVGRVTTCYKCRADFRDHPINPAHGPFELAVAEKYRESR